MRWVLIVGLVVPILVAAGAAGGLAMREGSPRRPPAERVAASAERCQDADGDGYGLWCAAGADCNDRDRAVHPGASEICNFRDDDCNALVDDAPTCTPPPFEPVRVDVPAGRFLMGSAEGARDERPVRAVALAAFQIDRYEVTNRRYRACVTAGKCAPPALGSSHRRARYYGEPAFLDYPVIFVGWQEATQYCRFAGGRLPTEAEWEKAARGGGESLRPFPWGDEPPDCSRANMGGAGSCGDDTDRVGRRLLGRSPYGALDMAGNVWEWVADWYDPDYYATAGSTDPSGPAAGTLKVARGGCWQSGADTLRVSCRKAELPTTFAYNLGFRCAYPKGR
ncbi:MAG: SUMF1/EgtB/PvdO family nonheme iron enzyme [Deltaproteobacteria bacterium]|nr:SUMF1/EgtB/PvdO family nonheme iron enzyme [Deltaproteobacteria bacterium]